jgi:hypothetical protein
MGKANRKEILKNKNAYECGPFSSSKVVNIFK